MKAKGSAGRPSGTRRVGQTKGLTREKRKELFPRFSQPWTTEEDIFLERDWGAFNVATIARRLGRTTASVEERASHLKLGPAGRGRKTIAAFVEETGYSRSRVLAAARFLDIELPRVAARGHRVAPARGRHYALDVKHERALLDLLSKAPDGAPLRAAPPAGASSPEASWVKHGGACGAASSYGAGCGRSDRPFFGRGLCQHCYQAAWRAKSPAAPLQRARRAHVLRERRATDPAWAEAKRARDRAYARASRARAAAGQP